MLPLIWYTALTQAAMVSESRAADRSPEPDPGWPVVRTSHDSGFVEFLVKRVAATLRADLAVVMRPDSQQERWAVAVEGVSALVHEAQRTMFVSSESLPLTIQVFTTEKPIVNAATSDCPDAEVWLPKSKGSCSFMAVPLVGIDGCFGVLALVRVEQGRAFTEHDVDQAQDYAFCVAGAMDALRRSERMAIENRVLQATVRETERTFRELAHEVRAPAGRMAQYATWIRQDCGHLLNHKANEYLSWIINEGKDLSELVDRSMDLVARRHQPPPVEPVETELIVREVLALLEGECRAKGVRVTVAGPLPTFLCHRIHVKQIIENLVSNAIKFMGGQRAPHVVIGAQETEEGRALFVRDNGVGIERSMLERIFLPFQRVHGENVSGAGLGLSIVKALADQCMGTVAVSSVVGLGSTFVIRLPCGPVSAGRAKG